MAGSADGRAVRRRGHQLGILTPHRTFQAEHSSAVAQLFAWSTSGIGHGTMPAVASQF
jgi:hypothetical protein